jgi:hypothetical protein
MVVAAINPMPRISKESRITINRFCKDQRMIGSTMMDRETCDLLGGRLIAS